MKLHAVNFHSFWRGAARPLSAYEAPARYTYKPATSLESLSKDWWAIGQDLQHGIKKYKSHYAALTK
jgi:hypothetical protein